MASPAKVLPPLRTVRHQKERDASPSPALTHGAGRRAAPPTGALSPQERRRMVDDLLLYTDHGHRSYHRTVPVSMSVGRVSRSNVLLPPMHGGAASHAPPAAGPSPSVHDTHAAFAQQNRAQVKARQWVQFDHHRGKGPKPSRCLPDVKKGGPPRRPGPEHRPTLADLLRNAVKEAGHNPPTASTCAAARPAAPARRETHAARVIQRWLRGLRSILAARTVVGAVEAAMAGTTTMAAPTESEAVAEGEAMDASCESSEQAASDVVGAIVLSALVAAEADDAGARET